MLFGLGGGLGFVYWRSKSVLAPFIGGRYGRGLDPVLRTCERLGAVPILYKTRSSKKGYRQLCEALRAGEPAITFVDMVYLPYLVLPEKAHFGGHTIVVYGLDEELDSVCVADRSRQPLSTTLGDLERGRNARAPPFDPQNQLLLLQAPSKIADLEPGIRESIRESCQMMLNPPIKNLGLVGLETWADQVPRWPEQFKGMDLFQCLLNVFTFIEISGTGGGSFRGMYAQYLHEASAVLDEPELKEVASLFRESGRTWSEIAKIALPDSWPTLGRLRELLVEKNRLFEDRGTAALARMREISQEIEEELIGRKISREFRTLDRKALDRLLSDMKDRIRELRQQEGEAFERLNRLVSS